MTLPMDNAARVDNDDWTMDGARIADTGTANAPHGFRWLATEVSYEGS